MKINLCIAILFAAISAALCGPAIAGGPPNVVTPQVQAMSGGRTLQVLVAQSEIKSDINKSNLTAAAGGGALFALIDASVESSRAKKAEAAIVPLRDALTGFDADALAQATAQASIAETAWFQPASSAFGKDSSVLGKSGVLDAATTEQVAFFEYTYDVSPEFDSVRVVLNIQFANRTMPPSKSKEPKPEIRLAPKNLAYTQTITSVVTLPSPSEEDINANVARWSADGAAATRTALTAAFKEVQRLTPRTLALTEDDIKAMNAKDKPKAVAGGFGGRQQTDSEPGTLLWTGGFVHVQPLPEPAPAATAPAEGPAEAPPAEAPSAEAAPTEQAPAEQAPADPAPAAAP